MKLIEIYASAASHSALLLSC